MNEFVLVHGMSHGAWAWEFCQARLERAGHRVIAVDLPGHGRRAHERARASIDGYAQAVIDAMLLGGVSRATVVGHSMGGVVVQRVAELVPSRIVHLVFLAAVVVPPGSSLFETQLSQSGQSMMRGLAAAGHGAVHYPAAMAWARWLGDMPAGDPRVVAALTRLTPQPLAPWTERVPFDRFYALELPRTYSRCLSDVAVPPAKAAEYARRLGVTPVDLPTAHEPMLSAPDELASLLERLSEPRDTRRTV